MTGEFPLNNAQTLIKDFKKANELLLNEVKNNGKKVYDVQSPKETFFKIIDLVLNGDLIIFMGAGSITSWSSYIFSELNKIDINFDDNNKKLVINYDM